MRTPDQMYEEAMKACLSAARGGGEKEFILTREEYFKLHNVPFRSWIGTAMDRDRITGKPQRICGLELKIKEDMENEALRRASEASRAVGDAMGKVDDAMRAAGDAMEQVGKAFDRVFNK